MSSFLDGNGVPVRFQAISTSVLTRFSSFQAVAISGGTITDAYKVVLTTSTGQIDRSVLPGGSSGWTNTDTTNAWSNTGS